MYGLVNQAVEDLITERFGRDVWQAVRTRAGVSDAAFVRMTPYPDDVTYRLVGAASDHLGIPADQLLEAFGEYWTLYTGREGYGELFVRGGRTFREFMLNLHALHSHVGAVFPDLRPPSFWCTEVHDDRLRLHYQSTREGLAPMVIGLVRGLGRMFATQVEIHRLDRSPGDDHDQFDVHYRPITGTPHA